MDEALTPYERGRYDALDGRRQSSKDPEYIRGFEAGYDEIIREREELDRSGSSNA